MSDNQNQNQDPIGAEVYTRLAAISEQLPDDWDYAFFAFPRGTGTGYVLTSLKPPQLVNNVLNFLRDMGVTIVTTTVNNAETS